MGWRVAGVIPVISELGALLMRDIDPMYQLLSNRFTPRQGRRGCKGEGLAEALRQWAGGSEDKSTKKPLPARTFPLLMG
ncbi:hypothetical protein HNR46_002526 [Haloferula luteola]|uniref:Uncharacterized protein n=1 Tax=Haloferula luteola TaxID=595692 RepID=A0A840V425_9BACT|nr:hypothetical protein [Haloferula luteola]